MAARQHVRLQWNVSGWDKDCLSERHEAYNVSFVCALSSLASATIAWYTFSSVISKPQYKKLSYPKVMDNSSPLSLHMGPWDQLPVNQSLHSSLTESPVVYSLADPENKIKLIKLISTVSMNCLVEILGRTRAQQYNTHCYVAAGVQLKEGISKGCGVAFVWY